MKHLSLVLFAAFSISFLSSCMKEYTCSCPMGTSATVKTVTKPDAKKACEEFGCTL